MFEVNMTKTKCTADDEVFGCYKNFYFEFMYNNWEHSQKVSEKLVLVTESS